MLQEVPRCQFAGVGGAAGTVSGTVGQQAFGMAAMTLAHVDVVEVHDFLSSSEPMTYEALGFAERFDADKFAGAVVTGVGGPSPLNPLQLRGKPSITSMTPITLAQNIIQPTTVLAVTILQRPGNQ